MTEIRYRCKAKTGNAFRTITVDTKRLIASCDCQGFSDSARSFCSHIDATLIAGERHMIPEDDHNLANQAMSILIGQLSPPENWKSSWRANNVWRGLSLPRKPRPRQVKNMKDQFGSNYYSLPKVCFTGKGPISRKLLIQAARESGWQAVDSFQSGIKVLVAEDPTKNTAKLNKAREFSTPILSYDEWETLNLDGII